MNKILHKASTRGFADHGWLRAAHSFSFGGYHNDERLHFGALRVLNDDRIAPGAGFGRHPHANMEIITIPLSGALEHQDSMGNKAVLSAGEVQVMSAGTGIEHSEKNASSKEELSLLQIWLFPNRQNVAPRYEDIRIDTAGQRNKFQQIVSPDAADGGAWIHQDAWFQLGNFDAGFAINYKIRKSGNGLYAFIIKGEATIAGQALETRDGLGITDATEVEIVVGADAEVLLIDLPMS